MSNFKQLCLTSCDIFVKSIPEKPVIHVASLYMHAMLSECVCLFGSGMDRAITHSSSQAHLKFSEGALTLILSLTFLWRPLLWHKEHSHYNYKKAVINNEVLYAAQ